MTFKNCWVEREEKYILIPLDGEISEKMANMKRQQGYDLFHVQLTDADLTEIFHQQEGVWTAMFDYVEKAGKLTPYI